MAAIKDNDDNDGLPKLTRLQEIQALVAWNEGARLRYRTREDWLRSPEGQEFLKPNPPRRGRGRAPRK